MAFKACAYKNCENYSIGRSIYGSEGITIFNFPKDPERAGKWVDLGCCEEVALARSKCMCSEHFEKRFFSTTSKRTVLLGHAVPNPYRSNSSTKQTVGEVEEGKDLIDISANDPSWESVKGEEDEELLMHVDYLEDYDNEDFETPSIHFNEVVADEEEYVQAADSSSSHVHEHSKELFEAEIIFKNSIETYTEQSNDCEQTSLNKGDTSVLPSGPACKRASTITKSPCQPKKRLTEIKHATNTKIISTQTSIGEEEKTFQNRSVQCEAKTENLREIDLIDNNYVKTFLYKCEEYVQMPKSYYIKEKAGLVNRIRRYEKFIQKIKRGMQYC